MWPVAAASTMTMSWSARPSIDSRTSHMILPMVRISFTPGAAVGDEVEHVRERTEPADDRHAEVELQVLAAATPRCPSPSRARRDRPRAGLNPTARLLELRGDVALGVDLDEQHALADARGEQRGRRGHRALADAALAREEQAAPVEQVGRRARSRYALPAAEADLAIRGVDRDLDVGELVGRDADACGPSSR